MDDSILKQYDKELALYTLFTRKVRSLIEEILAEHGVHVHSITDRVKDRESLAKKLERPDSHYSTLSDVTDVAGIRITTYFEDDVEAVARLIEKEFVVDPNNSVDKRKLLDPDRFGYLSLHHVVNITTDRCRLIEYRRFPNLNAEIQTRSILQHAWAEIEHDLGYKSSQEVPQAIRRRFSRLAGMLELADQEFTDIRKALNRYESEVPTQIREEPQLVAIDKASLTAFVSNSIVLKTIDSDIAKACGAQIQMRENFLARHVERLAHFSIRTIGDLETVLTETANDIVKFASHWLKESEYERLHAGISILYLGYVLIARRDRDSIRDYLNQFHIGQASERESLIERIQETHEAISI